MTRKKSSRRKRDPYTGQMKPTSIADAEIEVKEDVPDKIPAPSPKKKDDTRPVSIVSAKKVKNIYSTRVIVGADKTPSGRRYEFAVGQTLPVEPIDYHFLLSLNRNPGPGCCGGTPADQAQRHYFGVP